MGIEYRKSLFGCLLLLLQSLIRVLGLFSQPLLHGHQLHVGRRLFLNTLAHPLTDNEVYRFFLPQIPIGEVPHSPEDTLHPMVQRSKIRQLPLPHRQRLSRPSASVLLGQSISIVSPNIPIQVGER